jgi:peptidoglycan/xylan/chitin deacetylase (PgdA/CDA1 family)
MTLPGLSRLWPVAQRLKKLFAPKAIILMYHRVTQVGADPWGLGVTPSHFAEQLAVLQKDGQPMRLPELVQALWARKIPRRAVVVTFDDGYADNLYNVKPLLDQYNIPATMFLSSGYIGQER